MDLKRTIEIALALLLALALIYMFPQWPRIVQLAHNFPSYGIYVQAIAIVVIAYLFMFIVRRSLYRYFIQRGKKDLFEAVNVTVSTTLYFFMGIIFLSIVGVSTESTIIAASLVAAVVGLAASTVLSNSITAVYFNVARPFDVGDHVEIRYLIQGSTLGILVPVLYPRYLSADRVETSAFKGIVLGISLYYTHMKLDDSREVLIPNQGLVYGAVISVDKGRRLRYRIEVSKSVDFDLVAEKLRNVTYSELQRIEDISILIDEATLNTYMLAVTIDTKSREDFLQNSGKFAEKLRKMDMQGVRLV